MDIVKKYIVAVELSFLIGVGFCICVNASYVFIISIAILELWNTPKITDYAADTTTCCSILNSTNIVPFLKYLSLMFGVFVR